MKVKISALPVGACFIEASTGLGFQIAEFDFSCGTDEPDILAEAQEPSCFTLHGDCGSLELQLHPGDEFRFPGDLEVDEQKVEYYLAEEDKNIVKAFFGQSFEEVKTALEEAGNRRAQA